MCGIIGIIEKSNRLLRDERNKKAKKMLELINHRGPDDFNIVSIGDNMTFGFVRLAMLDYNKSMQPIYNEDRNCYLFFNGEIYNHRSLREELIAKGHTFRTDGDGEVILHLYEEGDFKFECLDGMFAFCIVDTKLNRIVLARDRFGIKPLYYYESNDSFIISSELKAIDSCNERLTISKIGLDLYKRCRFIPSPYTIYEEVKKLEPGSYIVYERGQIKQHLFHNERKVYHEIPYNILDIMKNNIREMNEADVDIGYFLSGGVDSSLILSVASRNNKDLRSFTVGYEQKFQYDESAIASQIANELGICHVNELLLLNDLPALLNTAIYYLDEPFYSSVSISTLKLAEMASKSVKGVFVGDGSDEIFFGYKYVHEALKKQNNTDILNSYFLSLGWLNNSEYKELTNGCGLLDEDFYQIMLKDCEMSNIAETLRRVEIYKRLPDYHLMRVDRMTMAHSIEARVPMLRNNFVDYVLGVPQQDLINPNDTKKYLKTKFSDYMTNVMTNTRKQPFTAPIKAWVDDIFINDIREKFNDRDLCDVCQFEKKVVLKILSDYETCKENEIKLWGIYMLLKWADIRREKLK